MHIDSLAAQLSGKPGYYYLATPYSKYPKGHEAAFRDASFVAAKLLERGVHVFCPIAHSHPLAVYGDMNKVDHDLWLKLDEKLMESAAGLIVAMLPGWSASYGVTFERQFFREAGKAPHYLHCRSFDGDLSVTRHALEAASFEWSSIPSRPMSHVRAKAAETPLDKEREERAAFCGGDQWTEEDLAKIAAAGPGPISWLAGPLPTRRLPPWVTDEVTDTHESTAYRAVSALAQTGPVDATERKERPITSGVLDYFPDAIMEVAKVSKTGNDKHNPGEPLHWARGKSMDHADCIARHLLDRGRFDPVDGSRHSASLAWRALALLQEEIETQKAETLNVDPKLVMARGAKPAEDIAAQATIEGVDGMFRVQEVRFDNGLTPREQMKQDALDEAEERRRASRPDKGW